MSDQKAWLVGEIPAATSHGRIPVAGWIKGHFGLDFRIWHDEISDDFTKGWCLTHIPTGRVTMGIFAPLAQAQELADAFAEMTDWSFAESEKAKDLVFLVRGFRNQHADTISLRSPLYSPLWPETIYPTGEAA